MRRVSTLVLFVVMASIDNTVLILLPELGPRIRHEFGVPNHLLGLLMGLILAVVALTGLAWGYRSDQTDRRRLLIVGTLTWAIPIAAVPLSHSYLTFCALLLLAAIGLGCIATVGYSLITDLVPARWRGFLLGLWGGAQALGTLTGGLLAGLLAPSAGWRAPFGLMALVGLACSGLALFAASPRKGQADTRVPTLTDQAQADDERITVADLGAILHTPTNRWLMLQGFLAQFTYGSLTWVTALLTVKLVAQGLDLQRANAVAALLWVFLQCGGVVALGWGWLGDWLQRRHPQARALLGAYGFWAAIPCFVVLFWAPLPLVGTRDGTAGAIVLQQIAGNGWWWVALLGAAVAVIAQAANAPNWFALVSEVNLPEHRGTAFSFVNLANNLGRAVGAFLVGATFDWLQQVLAAPTNYTLGLSLFQVFFVPAGLCFWCAARTSLTDAARVQTRLGQRVDRQQPRGGRRAVAAVGDLVAPGLSK